MKYGIGTSDPNQMQQKDFVLGKRPNYYLLSTLDEQSLKQNQIMQKSTKDSVFSQNGVQETSPRKANESPQIDKSKYTFGKENNIKQGDPLILGTARICTNSFKIAMASWSIQLKRNNSKLTILLIQNI